VCCVGSYVAAAGSTIVLEMLIRLIHHVTSRATRMTLFFEEILFSNFLTNNIIDQFIIVVK
jgi:hypothetical protein